MAKKKKIYISGTLTHLPESKRSQLREFYQAIANVCQEAGLGPYLPHLKGDPVQAPSLSPKQIDRMDRFEVKNSDLLIAYVGVPAIGIGIEVEMANRYGVPVVLIYEQGLMKKKLVSRLIRGNKAVIYEIKFSRKNEALLALKKFLSAWSAKH